VRGCFKIPSVPPISGRMPMLHIDAAVAALERDGVVLLPGVLSGEQLDGMRHAFERTISRVRINDIGGYHKMERARDMVDDVLLLDQAFVSLGVSPYVTEIVRRYVGAEFQLAECKGWRSRKTLREFQPWHGDGWYDDAAVDEIPRQLKLAVYMSDVRSGGFEYLKGSHRKVTPRPIPTNDVGAVWNQERLVIDGEAGTAFLFDTSGIHRQSSPILEPRLAVFYCYHNAALPLQQEDVAYGRYHPLNLNAAFLGGLSAEQQRILGFGDARHLPVQPRPSSHPKLDALFATLQELNFVFDEYTRLFERRMRLLRDRLVRRGGGNSSRGIRIIPNAGQESTVPRLE
jgi:Phytanoyl-CoA dioxygenase (PhyH)